MWFEFFLARVPFRTDAGRASIWPFALFFGDSYAGCAPDANLCVTKPPDPPKRK